MRQKMHQATLSAATVAFSLFQSVPINVGERSVELTCLKGRNTFFYVEENGKNCLM